MKIGKIIACHNKIDDLMVYLDIIRYHLCPLEIIIVHSMDYEEKYMEELSKYNLVRIKSYGHWLGPLLACTAGVKRAYEMGLDWVVYDNADDHLFNHKWELKNFQLLKDSQYLCGGYNWLSVGVYHDVTLNQLYLHVPSFYKTIDDAEAYFMRSSPLYLCEYKIPRWLKKTCTNIEKQFYRIPGREQEPGVGHERKDIYGAFQAKGIKHAPIGFWERLENNNRFFNFEWQMIGSHDVESRLVYWRKIRNLVPYGKQIEKDKHFSRFMEAARKGLPWNLPPGKPEPTAELPRKKPKLVSRKIIR
jgi:hypothetical protein